LDRFARKERKEGDRSKGLFLGEKREREKEREREHNRIGTAEIERI
jgi:hypothetical protein